MSRPSPRGAPPARNAPHKAALLAPRKAALLAPHKAALLAPHKAALLAPHKAALLAPPKAASHAPHKTALLALALATLSACSLESSSGGRRIPGGYTLMQKADFQALYDEDGRIVRLLQDRNRDGRAEAVLVYYPNGKPQRGEIDTDEDGVVDRWEYYRTDGSLEKVETRPVETRQAETHQAETPQAETPQADPHQPAAPPAETPQPAAPPTEPRPHD